MSAPVAKALTSGTEIGAPTLHHDPLDGAAADRAGLASFMGDLEVEMRCSQLALRADVAIYAGALAADGSLQDSPQTIM